jgi:hypothetical protein
MLTTHRHIAPKLILSENIYQFPHMTLWSEEGQIYRYRSIYLGLYIGKVYIIRYLESRPEVKHFMIENSFVTLW